MEICNPVLSSTTQMKPDDADAGNPFTPMMNNHFFATLFIGVMTLMLSAPVSHAGDDKSQTPLKINIEQKIEGYFNALSTLKASFALTTGDGQKKSGIFYLNRPGEMRFDYADSGDFIVADGRFIYFWDDDLNQQSQARIGSTMADFILRPELNIGSDVELLDWNQNNTTLTTTLTSAENPGLGKISLFFSKNPLVLRRWRVIDAQGNLTEVQLDNIDMSPKLTDDLFTFQRPDQQKSILEQR